MKYEKSKAEIIEFDGQFFMTGSSDVPGGARCGVFSNGHCDKVSVPNPYNPGIWNEHKSGVWVKDQYEPDGGHWIFYD